MTDTTEGEPGFIVITIKMREGIDYICRVPWHETDPPGESAMEVFVFAESYDGTLGFHGQFFNVEGEGSWTDIAHVRFPEDVYSFVSWTYVTESTMVKAEEKRKKAARQGQQTARSRRTGGSATFSMFGEA